MGEKNFYITRGDGIGNNTSKIFKNCEDAINSFDEIFKNSEKYKENYGYWFSFHLNEIFDKEEFENEVRLDMFMAENGMVSPEITDRNDVLERYRYVSQDCKGNLKIKCFEGQGYLEQPIQLFTYDLEFLHKIIAEFFNTGYSPVLRKQRIESQLRQHEKLFRDKGFFSEIFEKIKRDEIVNEEEFRIELKQLSKKNMMKIYKRELNDVIFRDMLFKQIEKYIKKNNIIRVVFENGKILKDNEINDFIETYLCIDYKNYKRIMKYEAVKMASNEKLSDYFEILEKDFDEDTEIY